MSTYQSILEISAEIAPTLTKKEVRKIASDEIDAIDARFKAENKSVNMKGVARNSLASAGKDMASGCLNIALPFTALGHFMRGNKKTAITQLIICGLSLIIPICAGEIIMGIALCYVMGFVIALALRIWDAILETKKAAKGIMNLTNPYIQWKNLTAPEHFSAIEHYNEYMNTLSRLEEHYVTIIKLCK